jgi:hypothetical protein
MVMTDVSLVVGHGGHSTTMQALAHDLPLVILPMFDRSDQPLVDSLIQRAGAAEVVSRRAAPATIRAAVDRMLAPGPHHAAAARLGAGADLGARYASLGPSPQTPTVLPVALGEGPLQTPRTFGPLTSGTPTAASNNVRPHPTVTGPLRRSVPNTCRSPAWSAGRRSLLHPAA